MSDQQQPPVYKTALGIEYDAAVGITAGNGRIEVRSVQEKLEKARSQWRTNPSPSSAPGVLTQGNNGTGQVACISKRPRSAKTLCGR